MSNYKPLQALPDDEDYRLLKENSNVAVLTRRLHELVPLLGFVGAKVEVASPKGVVLTIPLLESAMNQNGTQQAAVFYLLADYVVGVAIAAALPGTYTTGVHDRCHACPIQFWLKSGRVDHIAAGVGVIRGEAALSAEEIQRVRLQLIAKGRSQFIGKVQIFQGEQLVAVAEHEMGVYVDVPRASDKAASATQVQRLKVSALMISALREDVTSVALAGEQGVAIAQRMAKASPQLPSLVAARTRHLAKILSNEAATFSQVIVLGSGLDTKPLTRASASQKWFLCDLREMLRDRARRLGAIGLQDAHCVHVPLDFRLKGWARKIIDAGFKPEEPSLVVLEGVSMYLGEEELRRTLQEIQSLSQHPSSLVWIDHVRPELMVMDHPEVTSFLSSMARLGEPFVTGFDDAAVFAETSSWRQVVSINAADMIEGSDPVCEQYKFSVLASVVSDYVPVGSTGAQLAL